MVRLSSQGYEQTESYPIYITVKLEGVDRDKGERCLSLLEIRQQSVFFSFRKYEVSFPLKEIRAATKNLIIKMISRQPGDGSASTWLYGMVVR